jgi:hypothetical protein
MPGSAGRVLVAKTLLFVGAAERLHPRRTTSKQRAIFPTVETQKIFHFSFVIREFEFGSATQVFFLRSC